MIDLKMAKQLICILLILIVLASAASAALIKDIETKPSKVTPTTSKFTVKVELSGTTCGNQIRVYVDGDEFDSKNLGCERDDVETDTWDLKKDPLSCGKHKIRVDIVDGGIVTQTRDYDLSIGNVPEVKFSPERPVPGRETTITFTNPETGSAINGASMEIYYVRDGSSSAQSYSTNSKGEVKFSSETLGQYRILVEDPDYCGEFDFWVKKTMPFAGPNPEDPVVGERIGIAVPGGVGVKYVDSDGNIFPMMNMGGGVNITIDKPGDYTLIAGDLSTIYWSVVKNFTVSSRARMSAKLEPEKAVVDKIILLTVTSRDSPIASTPIKITKPVGGSETLETNSQGEVRFTPDSPGLYYYEVEKARYETLEGSFEAHNSFDITIDPREPVSNQNIKISVKDQRGDPVEDALVYIEDSTGILVTESTGVDGSFVFRLEEPKKYTAKIEKEGYWGFEDQIQVYGEIAMKLCPAEIEIGDEISISVTNIDDKETVATLTAAKPNGRSETITGKLYTPDDVGEYTITATKPDYRTVSAKLIVKPHPLELKERIEGDQLMVFALSNGEPVSGLTFLLKTPSEEKQVVTDDLGVASALVDDVGNLTIDANNIDKNTRYESMLLRRQVVKQYNYLFLMVPVFVVIVLTFLVILAIDFLHRMREKEKARSGGLFDKRKGGGGLGGGAGKGSLSGI